MAKLQAPSGFRDFLPDAQRKRNELIRRIRAVYESFGYEPMETPCMENLDVFLGKGGGENEKLMYLVLKRGEAFSRAFRSTFNALLHGWKKWEPPPKYELLRADRLKLSDEEWKKHVEEYDNQYHEKVIAYSIENVKKFHEHAVREARSLEYSDLGLRFDLTVPLARYYATHRGELPAVFKRYQVGPVWRAERPQHGRFREFVQCDIDVLGSTSMAVEADVILTVATALADLGFQGLTVRLNSRPLLNALVKSFGFSDEQIGAAFTGIDKLDKASPQEVKNELEGRGLDGAGVDKMLAFFAETKGKDAQALLDACAKQAGADGEALVAPLREIVALTPPLPGGKLVFDPSLARGMDYYTGPIFEVAAEGVPFSLAGGGRFDELIGKLGGQPTPACGFSIGFERVYTLMDERNMFAGASGAADALVVVPDAAGRAEALALGAELRSGGLRIDVYPGEAKAVKQYELAERKGIPFAAQAGPEAGKVTLRDLKTRKNEILARSDAAAWLKSKR